MAVAYFSGRCLPLSSGGCALEDTNTNRLVSLADIAGIHRETFGSRPRCLRAVSR